MKKVLLIFLILLGMSTTTYAYDKAVNTPIYRVYNPVTSEHLYTTAFGEAIKLRDQYGWRIEGCPWYSLVGQTKVYRLYNPEIDDHLYTADLNEINTILTYGCWLMDRNGYPCFWSGGSLPVYRLYFPASGRHLLTTDLNEYNVLAQKGWIQEGVAFYGVPESELV